MKFLILLFSIGILFQSCSKKCDLPENSVGGAIVKNVVMKSVNVKTTIDEGAGVIVRSEDENKDYGSCMVSYDEGENYQLIDFATYDLLGVKTSILCSSSFKRSVEINDITKVVDYRIDLTQCEVGCDFNVTVYNWVLIPKVPADYEIEVFL